MKTSIWLIIVAVSSPLFLAGCATTGSAPNSAMTTAPAKNQVQVNAATRQKFEAVAAAIQKQMQPGGRWQYTTPSERKTIDANFADMRTLFGKYASVDKMTTDAKMRMLEDQSTINAILTKRDGKRIVCKRRPRVGTHLPVKYCKTYAAIQADRQRSQEGLRKRIEKGMLQVCGITACKNKTGGH